jgi:atypical dual specificity phosphatase
MPLNNESLFNWVIPNKLAASPFPLTRELFTLPKLNIMLVVNLTKHGISNRFKEQLKSQGVRWKRFFIPDFGIPDSQTIIQYLECVCNTIQKNQAVLTHCLAGCGRTGTMIGLFLVTHGHSPEEALEKIHTAIGEKCPETQKQIQLLYQYNRKCPNYAQCKGALL